MTDSKTLRPRAERFTRQEVKRIMEMKDQGVSADEIATYFGRSRGSIYQVCHRYKNGGMAFTLDEWAAHHDRMIFLAEHGVTPTEIAAIYQTFPETITRLLMRSGLDKETRGESIEDLPPEARTTTHLNISPSLRAAKPSRWRQSWRASRNKRESA